MTNIRIASCSLVALAVLISPASAREERKTLFQVLFPKAHERKLERQRLQREIQAQGQQSVNVEQVAKVPKTKYYAYKVAKRSPIIIKPLELEYASVGSVDGVLAGHPVHPSANPDQQTLPKPSQMTIDLEKAGKFRMSAEAFLSAAVAKYYDENQAYVWINADGEYNARARSSLKVLQKASEYGLRPEDYAIDFAPLSVTDEGGDVERIEATNRIKKDVAFTVAVLRYAMDAKYGTVNPNLLSGYHDFPVHQGKALKVLQHFLSKGLPARNLVAMHPSNEKFLALKEELAGISFAQDDVIELPEKVLIRPGMNSQHLPGFVDAIKMRGSQDLLSAHADFLSSYAGETAYSKPVVALVKAYQKEAGLGPDGVIGPNTARKLAGVSPQSKVDRVVLAMERLRWHPHQLGQRHVFINQPEFRARYIENGSEKLSMRVVVGKRSNQTNFFFDKIEHVVYNPYWGVPRSIIVNEFAVKSRGNPGYLDQKGYEVTTFGGKRISSSSIDWYTIGTNPNFAVRQPPGAKNALGKLKIMFPNKHSIYMHDTPAKNLFNRSARAFSHGCVRLHDPQAMAAAVLGRSKGHVNSMISKGTNQTEKLGVQVPVYVSYFTAWPQEDGTVKYFTDMYGRDKHLLKAMELTQKARTLRITS